MTRLKGNVEDPKNLPSKLTYGCVGPILDWSLPTMRDWQTEEDWFTAKTFMSAINWLERNQDAEKFLLVVDEFDPHEPWNAPKNILELYFDVNNYTGRRIINTKISRRFREDELEYIRAQYAGEVTLVDKYIGKLFDKLKELGMWDDTIIIVMSDHGCGLMDHGIMHKSARHMYPEQMDLVLIIRHPEYAEYSGKTCDAFVGPHDILPTLLSFTGLSSPQPLDGRNIWDWVTGEKIDRRRYMTCRFGNMVWCRDENYAFFSDLDGQQAKLFDLRRDPKQNINIADENPDICSRMYKRILNDADGPLPHYTRIAGYPWFLKRD